MKQWGLIICLFSFQAYGDSSLLTRQQEPNYVYECLPSETILALNSGYSENVRGKLKCTDFVRFEEQKPESQSIHYIFAWDKRQEFSKTWLLVRLLNGDFVWIEEKGEEDEHNGAFEIEKFLTSSQNRQFSFSKDWDQKVYVRPLGRQFQILKKDKCSVQKVKNINGRFWMLVALSPDGDATKQKSAEGRNDQADEFYTVKGWIPLVRQDGHLNIKADPCY